MRQLKWQLTDLSVLARAFHAYNLLNLIFAVLERSLYNCG